MRRNAGQDGRPLFAKLEGDATELRADVRKALELLGEKPRVAAEIEAVIMYLYFADMADTGCRSFQDTILAKLAADTLRPLVLSLRTLQRRLARMRQYGMTRWWRDDHGRPVNLVDVAAIQRAARPGGPDPTGDVTGELARRASASGRGLDGSRNGGRMEADAAVTRRTSSPAKGGADATRQSGGTSRQSGGTSRQSGGTSRQSGGCNKSNVLSSDSNTTPLPPGTKLEIRSSKSEGVDRPGHADPAGQTWNQVVVELKACGLGYATQAARKARALGYGPAECLAVIAHWRSYRPAWAEGALYRRLAAVDPGLPPGDGWPAVSEVARMAVKAAARERRDERQRQQRRAHALVLEREARAAAELEAAAGPALDNLAATLEGQRELRQLASRVLGPGTALWGVFLKRGASDPIVRGALLEAVCQTSTLDANGKWS